MAEARGRPRPGQPHPDAEADDPDGVHGGVDRDEHPEFEEEAALPGGEVDGDNDEEGREGAASLHQSKPRHPVDDAEMDDVVHRASDATEAIASTRASGRRCLLRAFLHDHSNGYRRCRLPFMVIPSVPILRAFSEQEQKSAKEHQKAVAELRKVEETQVGSGAAVAGGHLQGEPRVSPLGAGALPVSPLDVAMELIACSGVWQSREQYLVALFLVQPIQDLWEKARQQGNAFRHRRR